MAPLYHGDLSSPFCHGIRLCCILSMQTGCNVVESHFGWHMLELRCLWWFHLLGQRLYNHNGYYFGSCSNQCILEITNAFRDQAWGLHYDGTDDAFRHCHDRESHIYPPIYESHRPSSVFSFHLWLINWLRSHSLGCGTIGSLGLVSHCLIPFLTVYANLCVRIEQNVVIVAACVPTLRPFFRKVFQSTKGSSGDNTSRSRSGFKVPVNPLHSWSNRPASVSEFPLKDNIRQESRDGDSHTSEWFSWNKILWCPE